MPRTPIMLTLALATLLACQAGDDPSTAPSSAFPATSGPNLAAVNLKVVQPFFLIFDDVPGRNYTATFGLVSPPSDLNATVTLPAFTIGLQQVDLGGLAPGS